MPEGKSPTSTPVVPSRERIFKYLLPEVQVRISDHVVPQVHSVPNLAGVRSTDLPGGQTYPSLEPAGRWLTAASRWVPETSLRNVASWSFRPRVNRGSPCRKGPSTRSEFHENLGGGALQLSPARGELGELKPGCCSIRNARKHRRCCGMSRRGDIVPDKTPGHGRNQCDFRPRNIGRSLAHRA